MTRILFLPLLAVVAAPAAATSPQALADDLIAAERAHAAASSGAPAAAALLPLFDDSIVAFVVPVPGLASGKSEAAELIEKGFGTARVQWSTVRHGISADGSHGFSFGFMDKAPEADSAQPGKYVAYWVKRPAGWRIAAFKWVPREAGVVSSEQRPPSLPAKVASAAANAASIEAARKALDLAERAFSDEAQRIGLGPAFAKFGRADAVNVGGGADFTYGNEAIAAVVGDPSAPGSSPVTWAPDGVLVAPSGDLGLTYGYLSRNGPVPAGRLAKIPFFTIWRRDSPDAPWRYVAE